MDINKTCLTMRLDYVLRVGVDTIVGSIVNTSYVITTEKIKKFFILTSYSFTSQLQHSWNLNWQSAWFIAIANWTDETIPDAIQSDPAVKIICGVGSAHNRATYLKIPREFLSETQQQQAAGRRLDLRLNLHFTSQRVDTQMPINLKALLCLQDSQ